MKINITKKEYRTFLEIFQIADWVLHSYETDEFQMNGLTRINIKA